jgi:hypothetical protein
VALNGLGGPVTQTKNGTARAPVNEKPGILEDIREFEKDEIAPAKAKLAADTRLLERCRAGANTVVNNPPVHAGVM